jgi:hypothetical protein
MVSEATSNSESMTVNNLGNTNINRGVIHLFLFLFPAGIVDSCFTCEGIIVSSTWDSLMRWQPPHGMIQAF